MVCPTLTATLLALLSVAAPESQAEARGASPGDSPASGLVALPSDALAMSGFAPLGDVARAALPPPPQTVLIETRYYGTVTVDHAAHLARRTPCKSCHGPGPITKLVHMPPKVAHGRCLTCHTEQQRGPRKCAECHVKAPEQPAPMLTAAATGSAAPAPATTARGDGAVQPAGASAPAPLASAAPSATPATAPVALVPHDVVEVRRPGARRVIEVGYSVLSSPGGAGLDGISVRVTAEHDGVALVESVEYGRDAGASRTLALIGGGPVRSVGTRFRVYGHAVAGIDALSPRVAQSRIAPIAGARLGLELLSGAVPGGRISLSTTGAWVLTGASADHGERVGAFLAGVALSMGMPVGGQR